MNILCFSVNLTTFLSVHSQNEQETHPHPNPQKKLRCITIIYSFPSPHTQDPQLCAKFSEQVINFYLLSHRRTSRNSVSAQSMICHADMLKVNEKLRTIM